MTAFVLTAAALAVLALALLTRPLWLKSATRPSGAGDSAELRSQLEQLTALHKSGVIGKSQFNEARTGLERRIAGTAGDKPADTTTDAPRASKGLLLGLSGFVCAVAAASYMLLGTPQALNPDWVERQSAAAGAEAGHSITATQIEAMTDKLAARLKEQPDDAEGWAMLGRSYAVLGRHDQAAQAFKQAMSLRPDDASVLADYADALAMVNGRNLEGEPSRLIDRALKADPNNLKALSLAGTVAFYRKDYAGALRHWEKMTQIAPNSEFVQQIQGGIDEARKLMGGPSVAPVAAQGGAQPAPASTGTSISGTVTLAAALAGKASPDDALFVFARPAEGPRMPLAMIRKQVKDLPLTFKLDDSMAMSPAARLSSTQSVVVGARISKRGDATAQVGDLQGLSAPVAPGASGLKLEISEVVNP